MAAAPLQFTEGSNPCQSRMRPRRPCPPADRGSHRRSAHQVSCIRHRRGQQRRAALLTARSCRRCSGSRCRPSRDGGADRGRRRRDLLCRLPRHRRAGRRGAGVPDLHADDHHVERRVRRRRRIRGCARGRCRPPRRCRGCVVSRRGAGDHCRRRVHAAASSSAVRPLYRALGGRATRSRRRSPTPNYPFAGAIPVWIVNLLAAALRGAGNVKVPALVTWSARS